MFYNYSSIFFPAASDGSLLGHLASFSVNLQLEVYALNSSAAALEYVTEVQQDGSLSLRPPCPSCSPSYNQLTLTSTPHQTLIPVAQRIIVTSIINDQPYIQLLKMDGCDPISMLKPQMNSDLLYLQCRTVSSESTRVLYQLARLAQNTQDITEQQWSFQPYDDFDDFTSEGEYYEYHDRSADRYEVYFVYTRSGELVFEGPDTGYFRFFALPDGCAKAVRLTPITDTKHRIIMECSATVQSNTISSVYAFDPETGDMANILSGVEYSKSPIRFSKDGSILAIFTDTMVLITDCLAADGTPIRVPVQGAGAPYDGLLTTIGTVTYAVYSTREGLFTFSVSQALQGGHGTTATRLLEQSGDICAEEGCPLLVLVEENRVLATLDHQLALYSINPPLLVNRVATTYQPARFVYRKYPSSQPPSPPSPSPSPSPPPTELPTSRIPTPIVQSGDTQSNETGSQPVVTDKIAVSNNHLSKGAVTAIIIVSCLAGVVFLVAVLVMVHCKRKNASGYSRFNGTR